jgi:hypothetical protein
MLKPKKKVRPTDVNQLARHMVDVLTGQSDSTSEPTRDEVSRVMASLGRKGGKIGGKRRMETMTAKERSDVALKAAQTRWENERRKRAKRAKAR